MDWVLPTAALAVPVFMGAWGLVMKDLSPSFRWVGTAILALFGIGVIAAYQHQLKTDSQPVVSFEYENNENYVVPPSRRPFENNYGVRVKVTTTQYLKNACVYFKEFYRADKAGAPPVDVTGRIGWYLGASSFECHNIDQDAFFLLFYAYNQLLEVFVRDYKGSDTIPAQLESLKNIEPGEYKIRILLHADNLKNGISQTYRVKWRGDISKPGAFEMESAN
jgi:hypothetical protein